MTNDKISRASLNYIRFSPRKLMRITRLINGKTYEESLSILAFLPYKICTTIIKVLRASAGNAKQNLLTRKQAGITDSSRTSEPVKTFFVKATVEKGPLMKRLRPAAKGLGWQFLRRTSHLIIELQY